MVLSGGKKRSVSHMFIQTDCTHGGKFRLTPTPFVLILRPSQGKKKTQKKLIRHCHMIAYMLEKNPKLKMELMTSLIDSSDTQVTAKDVVTGHLCSLPVTA